MSSRKKRDLKIYLVSAFVIYILIVLYITIFNRMPEEKRVDMELFRSYRLLINDKNYLKIAVILIDTKTIIDSYFENDKKIKELLMKEIQQNKVE